VHLRPGHVVLIFTRPSELAAIYAFYPQTVVNEFKNLNAINPGWCGTPDHQKYRR
jgi:hypothetical protein